MPILYTNGTIKLDAVWCYSAHMWIILLILPLLQAAAESVPAGKVVKSSLVVAGEKRSYCIYVPQQIAHSESLPLLVTLHGSGRRGFTLVELWKKLAEEEDFIVVGPDSLNPAGWTTPGDGPQPLYELIEMLKEHYPINVRRVYLFGHSAGGVFTLLMGLMQSKYFAAGALSAGAISPDYYDNIRVAERKIPFSIFVGTRDRFFPLDFVRATRDALQQRGIPVTMKEISNHDHNYYRIADQINQEAWAFLKRQQLENEPEYKLYKFE